MNQPTDYTRWPTVEGYCLPCSLGPGDTVQVRCSSRTDRVSARVELVSGPARTTWEAAGIPTVEQPVPKRAWAEGCDWGTTFAVSTGPDWPSGLYLVRLRAESGGRAGHDDPAGPEPERAESQAFFVLRPRPFASTDRIGSTRSTDRILLALSTNTWNAYNQWGGRCFYSGTDRVSFARPIERGYFVRPPAPTEAAFDGRVTNIAEPSDPEHRALVDYQRVGRWPLWTGSADWHNWERRFVGWAAEEGIGVDVVTNRDLDDHPEILDRRRLLVSVGHDEYWSSATRP